MKSNTGKIYNKLQDDSLARNSIGNNLIIENENNKNNNNQPQNNQDIINTNENEKYSSNINISKYTDNNNNNSINNNNNNISISNNYINTSESKNTNINNNNKLLNTTIDIEKEKDNNENQNYPSSHYFRQKKKYGNLLTGFDLGNGPLLVLGPDWKFFLCLTSVVFISFFLIFIILSKKINYYLNLIGVIIYFIQFVSYTITSFLNPGLSSNKFLENPQFKYDEKDYHPCLECGLLINDNTKDITFHCFECDVCIEGYDHHCPWVTKCIGKNNLKVFYIFVVSTFCYMIILFLAVITIEEL